MSVLKSTGNPDIDKTHEKMCSLIESIYTSKNKIDILDALLILSTEHFIEEENLMRDIFYPFRNTHYFAHEDIFIKISSLKRAIELSNTNEYVQFLIINLKKVIEEHVENFDVALFLYNEWKCGQTGEGATSSLPS